METVIPRLHASPPEPLGFGPDLQIRAFLLEREQGNLLLYRAATVEGEAARLRELGGISRQYLNHSHEAAPICDWVTETFDAPLLCHEDDAEAVARSCTVAHTFNRRHHLDEDFEVIPTPGHTPGATCYLWDSGERRCLFTGDTLMVSGGEWVAALLEGSDRERYIESLELIRTLDFDLLVPSVASAGEPHSAAVGPGEAAERIDAIIARWRSAP